MNPLDLPLEEAIAEVIATDLTGGSVYVLNRHDLARRAALEGFRQGIRLAAKIVNEMAADHERTGEEAKGALLRVAIKQIRTLPGDVP
jgi:hypothetical protein